ncbi:unnamed protein product [Prorocentrum cordatum]|uniref:Uncharacterized protein n=1 Tax=Prorocentrum cordatum TaxID=2364126 RepID=A0ABN9UCF8_9DINO|nr:unnamed protein product [Polarella glacialis]
MERRRYNREEEGRGTGSGEKRERRGSAAAAEGGGRPREHGSLPRRERGTSRPEDERCEQPVADTADGRSRPEGLSASSSVVTPLVRARGRGEGRSREGKAGKPHRDGGGGGKKADRRRELALSRAHQLTGRRARLRWGASGRPWIKRGASRGARARAALARPSFQGGQHGATGDRWNDTESQWLCTPRKKQQRRRSSSSWLGSPSAGPQPPLRAEAARLADAPAAVSGDGDHGGARVLAESGLRRAGAGFASSGLSGFSSGWRASSATAMAAAFSPRPAA